MWHCIDLRDMNVWVQEIYYSANEIGILYTVLVYDAAVRLIHNDALLSQNLQHTSYMIQPLLVFKLSSSRLGVEVLVSVFEVSESSAIRYDDYPNLAFAQFI